nr:e3 ubiquitin-protein ligase listerin [Quercus suber]
MLKVKGCSFQKSCTIYRGNDIVAQLKALASLSVLHKQKSRKDIVPIIPQWAFEYKSLLQDYNWEVRRATHDTMTNLVITVGRDLAPHLKSLMGPWWFSQFDPVFEVPQAAKWSLQVAFPAQEKRLDALILCTNEIFMYLEENIPRILALSKKNPATFGPLSHQSQAPRSEAPPASFSFCWRRLSPAITLPFTLKFSFPHKPEPPTSSSLSGSSRLLPFSLTHLEQTKEVTKRLLERCDAGGGEGSFSA